MEDWLGSTFFLRLLVGLLAALGGFVWFVIITSRILSYLPPATPKSFFVPLLFVILVGGPAIAGFVLGQSPWAWLLLAASLASVFYWSWDAWQERKLRGSQPVQIFGRKRSFLRPLTTTHLCVFHYQVALANWSGQVRIAHLSDFHFSYRLPLAYYLEAIERSNASQPDLVLITGDFISDLGSLPLVSELLPKIESRLGCYAIFGNHDIWAGERQVGEAVTGAGVNLLRLEPWHIPAQAGRGAIRLEGCDAPWGQRACQSGEPAEQELALVLSHTADNVYAFSRAGAHVVFSGHYHAGQVQLPGFGPVFIPSSFGRRLSHGHFIVNATHLFVSAGVGVGSPALRIYCPPDIFIVDILGQA